MLNDTHVTTSYANGTIISMDAVSTKMFLENIAITTIAQCREMVSKKRMGVLESTTKLPYYDELIEEYCAGVHGAVLSNMLCQNVQILYRFIQDCVLNDTSRGLYLLYEKSNLLTESSFIRLYGDLLVFNTAKIIRCTKAL